jgi:predicted nucleic acid-binding protein
MSFSLDTSALLDAWVRYYPLDVFPTLWEKIDEASRDGRIYVVEEVVTELKRKDDGIYEWVKKRESMIVSIDEELQRAVVEIMGKYPKLVDTRKNRSGCDPWVIALAKSRGLTLVTAEKPGGTLSRPRIPDVCIGLGIPCVDVIEFFRMQGWRV